jgi:hypothetical protein
MSNPTTPFGWQMPTATDLVTDLPADFEVFGQAVATSMGDLLGGTSGQILAKNSNTDMDFVWIANDQGDITGVTATSPLTGGGTSGAITVGIQDALTTQKGAVQLSDSTSTTSSILAATPTAVKAAYDLADGAIAKTTVTTAGDIIYRNATVPVRLGIGTAGQVLKVNSGATAPEWSTLAATTFNTGYAYTASTQTTSSSSYVDLSTTTSVTVTTGTKALVAIKSQFGNEALGGGVWAHVSFAVSGATTVAASNERSIGGYFTYAGQWIKADGATFVLEGLTAGSNTFTLKFSAAGGFTTPATFYERSISVVNLGS